MSIDNLDNIENLIKNFEIEKFSKNSVLFNDDDLYRMNSKNIKELPFKDLKRYLNFDYDEKFWEIIRGNVEKFEEIKEWHNIVYQGSSVKIQVDEKLLNLIKTNIPDKINKDFWQVWTKSILESAEIKPKELFIKIRILLTGKKFGPSMNELLTLFNKTEILKRIDENSEK